ncbi:hypothetical protein [Longispora urticae]
MVNESPTDGDPGGPVPGARRRRLIWTGALVTGVLVVAGGLALALRPERGGAPAAHRSPGPPHGASTPRELGLVFLDPQRGYSLAARCGADGVCGTHLGRTDDGGRHWSWHRLPETVVRSASPQGETTSSGEPRFQVVSASGVVVDLSDTDRLVTTDDGVTWTPQSTAPQGTVEELPPGAGVTASVGSGPGEIRLTATRPDGAAVLLAHPPEARVRGFAATVANQGGVLCVSAQDASGHVLLVSRDRGRTWQTVPVPREVAMDGLARGKVHPAAGVIYLPDDSNRRVWRHDGTGWTSFDLPAKSTGSSIPPISTARQDGVDGLIVADSATAAVYEVSGAGVKKILDGRSPMLTVGAAGTLMTGQGMARGDGGASGSDTVLLSADGRTWTELRY